MIPSWLRLTLSCRARQECKTIQSIWWSNVHWMKWIAIRAHARFFLWNRIINLKMQWNGIIYMDWGTCRGVLKSKPIRDTGSAEHAQMGHLWAIHSDRPSGPHHVDFGCHIEWLLATHQRFHSSVAYEFQALRHSIIILSNMKNILHSNFPHLSRAIKGQGSPESLFLLISMGHRLYHST